MSPKILRTQPEYAPEVLRRSNFFETVPTEIVSIQLGAAVVSRDAPLRHEYLKKGYLQTDGSLGRQVFRLFVQSNPDAQVYFDSFRVALESTSSRLQLLPLLQAIERVSIEMYGRWAKHGVLVHHSPARTTYFIHGQRAWNWSKRLGRPTRQEVRSRKIVEVKTEDGRIEKESSPPTACYTRPPAGRAGL